MSNTEKAVRRYNSYLDDVFPSMCDYDPRNKKDNINTIVRYMFNRTQSMFTWDGLPETIPARILELYLQINGNCAFLRREGELYIYTGGLGGRPDVYYRPTIYTISNPAQGFSINAKIDEDCIVMRNDSLYMGLSPLFLRYASNMVETELSMFVANINTRIISLLSAQDDRTRKSAETYLQRIEEGNIGVISEREFFEDLKTSPFATSNAHAVITDLIELMQYHKASMWNEIGLNANYNMKRESINSGESQLNNDALLPLVDDMLKQRQEGAEQVNQMFGTSIRVDFASAWKDNVEEIQAEQNKLENEGGEDSESGEISTERNDVNTSESTK